MTDEEIAKVYERVRHMRRKEGYADDYYKICALIAELGDVPLRRVEYVCDALD